MSRGTTRSWRPVPLAGPVDEDDGAAPGQTAAAGPAHEEAPAGGGHDDDDLAEPEEPVDPWSDYLRDRGTEGRGWRSRARSGFHVASIRNTTALDKGFWVGSHGSVTPHARSDGGQDDKGKPTEKLMVPEYDGEGGSDAEVGREARSYIRRVQVWRRCTKLPPRQQALALYTALKGKAWIYAEELSVDLLASERGMDYFLEWIQTRFMEAEVSKVSCVMAELFKKCKKKPEQSVRDFNVEFERLVLRLHELHCELPALVKAWLYVDKLRLSEAEELTLLSSVNNEYDVRRLQQAALIQDRGLRRSGQQAEAGQPKGVLRRWGPRPAWRRAPDDEVVDKEVAAQCYSAYMAYQSAKDRYREAIRGRGVDQDAVRHRNEQRLKEAKARSYCSVCKRRGHWHKDPECPLRGKVPAKGDSERGPEKTQHAQMCNQVFMCGGADDCPGVVLKDLLENGPRDTTDGTSVGERGCSQGAWMMAAGASGGGDGEKGMTAIVDTACTRSVAGHAWFEQYCQFLEKVGPGLQPKIVESADQFRFGASRVHTSKLSVDAWFATQGRPYVVNVAIVPCRVPLLFSRPVLASLGACYDVAAQQVDFVKLGLSKVPMLTGDTGHPVIPVDQFCDGRVPELRIPDFVDAWIPSAMPEYKSVCAVSAPPQPAARDGIFYPKKLDALLEELAGTRRTEAICQAATTATQIRTSSEPPGEWPAHCLRRKDEILEELGSYDVLVHPKWCVPELRDILIEQRQIHGIPKANAADPMKGISKMTLEELTNEAQRQNLTLPTKPTKGALMRMLRDSKATEGDTIVRFGKYKTWYYKELPHGYLRWDPKDPAKEKKEARFDPEAQAKNPPPKMTARRDPGTSSDGSWATVGAKPFRPMDRGGRQSRLREDSPSSMDDEPSGEAMIEIAAIEAKLAALKQKHGGGYHTAYVTLNDVDLEESEGEAPRPRTKAEARQQAVEGIRRKCRDRPLREKLFGGARTLVGALGVWLVMMQSVVAEPIKDAWAVMQPRHHHPEDDQRADFLELFGGRSPRLSEGFAKRRRKVLMPRDPLHGHDLCNMAVQDEILREIGEERPKVIWMSPPVLHETRRNRGHGENNQAQRRDRKRENVIMDFLRREPGLLHLEQAVTLLASRASATLGRHAPGGALDWKPKEPKFSQPTQFRKEPGDQLQGASQRQGGQHFAEDPPVRPPKVAHPAAYLDLNEMAFTTGWLRWAGAPKMVLADLEVSMRCSAGQAHWQNGVAERHGASWKAIWDKVVATQGTVLEEAEATVAAVTEAKNSLRNHSGFSPRQWLFGTNDQRGDDYEAVPGGSGDPHDATTPGTKFAPLQALRMAAKTAFFETKVKEATKRAESHKPRVENTPYEPGEGSNYWLARGGRCLLAAPEHLRSAEHAEVNEMLRVKLALNEVKKLLKENDPDSYEVLGEGYDMEVDDHGDDVPYNIKKARLEQPREPGSAHGGAQILGEGPREELKWHEIPDSEKALYIDAEELQWKEHVKYEAVRELSLEESARVRREVPASRILRSRFAYKDKNYAKRKADASLPPKPKARLCVAGQTDPDLGQRDMMVDAPTASRHSILLACQLALERGWKASIGDIRAAFLNGVKAPRDLYFEQPRRGIPGLSRGQLVEILKGVFGLSTSPKLWWLKLSEELLSLELEHCGEKLTTTQHPVDPCVFLVRGAQSGKTFGIILTHVDDLMLLSEPELRKPIQELLNQRFPVDGWEDDEFEYIGCEYSFSDEEVRIGQRSYTENRVDSVSLEKGAADSDEATAEQVEENRTSVGSLSWLAKQTRPDLQFAVANCQRHQNHPIVRDLKYTNKAVATAKARKEEALVLRRVGEQNLAICVYHDAAWANVPDDAASPEDQAWLGEHQVASQLGYLVMAMGKQALRGESTPFSLLDWRSKASSRVCRSTFAGETMSCGEGLESALYLRSLLVGMITGKPATEEAAAWHVPIHLFTDCRSLYDHVHREGAPKAPTEKRLAIDLAAIRQTLMREAKIQWCQRYGHEVALTPERPLRPPLHWVPTEDQLSDMMTKLMRPDDWWSACESGRITIPLKS
ncbi:RE1 [Symbiodinium sp. CCMP2592]|nr:RE1 [Symbiodinium sp. CCMP2592]